MSDLQLQNLSNSQANNCLDTKETILIIGGTASHTSKNPYASQVFGEMMDGGVGNDIMYGTESHDVMFGGSGNDVMEGGAGDDIMHGN